MLVATAFLYDWYISAFRLVFVALRQEDRDIWHAMGCVSDVRLSMCRVIRRYKLGGISSGCYCRGFYIRKTFCSSTGGDQFFAPSV